MSNPTLELETLLPRSHDEIFERLIAPEDHEAMVEAARFRLPEDWREGRELVDGVTIDGKNPAYTSSEFQEARDRDDVLGRIEKHVDGSWTVRIGVADIGSFLHLLPETTKMALRKGWTTYSSEAKTIDPLLPWTLSEDHFSVLDDRSGEDQPDTPILTFIIDTDAQGNITGVDVAHERVIPVAYSYQEANEVILGDYTEAESEVLGLYYEFSQVIRQNRINSGDLSPTWAAALEKERSPSNLMIEDMMRLTGAAARFYMQANSVPGISRYHIQTEAQDGAITHSRGEFRPLNWAWNIITRLQRKGKSRSRLDVETLRASSLLRRADDLVNLANIAAFHDGRELPFDQARIVEISEHLNELQNEQRRRRSRRFGAQAVAAAVATP